MQRKKKVGSYIKTNREAIDSVNIANLKRDLIKEIKKPERSLYNVKFRLGQINDDFNNDFIRDAYTAVITSFYYKKPRFARIK